MCQVIVLMSESQSYYFSDRGPCWTWQLRAGPDLAYVQRGGSSMLLWPCSVHSKPTTSLLICSDAKLGHHAISGHTHTTNGYLKEHLASHDQGINSPPDIWRQEPRWPMPHADGHSGHMNILPWTLLQVLCCQPRGLTNISCSISELCQVTPRTWAIPGWSCCLLEDTEILSSMLRRRRPLYLHM